MDPWATKVSSINGECDSNPDDLAFGTGGVALVLADNQTTSDSFQDNFIPAHEATEDTSSFQKLPDSDQYLASLESKLRKIQNPSSSTGPESKEIVKSLEQTRESYMIQLLTNNTTDSLEINTQEDLNINPILKKLLPEKQALNSEELVHLVKADQLSPPEELEPEPNKKD